MSDLCKAISNPNVKLQNKRDEVYSNRKEDSISKFEKVAKRQRPKDHSPHGKDNQDLFRKPSNEMEKYKPKCVINVFRSANRNVKQLIAR